MVPEQDLWVSKEESKEAHCCDEKLESARKLVISGEERVCQGKGRGVTKFVYQNELLYREYTRDEQSSFQLELPTLIP